MNVERGKNSYPAATQVYDDTNAGTPSGSVKITIQNRRHGRSVQVTSTASSTPTTTVPSVTHTTSWIVLRISGMVVGLSSMSSSCPGWIPSRTRRYATGSSDNAATT